MARELDKMAADFRNRPLDQGPYRFVWIDALTQKALRTAPVRLPGRLSIAEGVLTDSGKSAFVSDRAAAGMVSCDVPYLSCAACLGKYGEYGQGC